MRERATVEGWHALTGKRHVELAAADVYKACRRKRTQRERLELYQDFLMASQKIFHALAKKVDGLDDSAVSS